ncbi:MULTISPECIES: hypothetical protein [unclassified Saccharothrix]|uniref:hypothetical protein n=1 Tax=unclassified Saccharothrix TaxID=2593673 RepID=UPI00307E2D67
MAEWKVRLQQVPLRTFAAHLVHQLFEGRPVAAQSALQRPRVESQAGRDRFDPRAAGRQAARLQGPDLGQQAAGGIGWRGVEVVLDENSELRIVGEVPGDAWKSKPQNSWLAFRRQPKNSVVRRLE